MVSSMKISTRIIWKRFILGIVQPNRAAEVDDQSKHNDGRYG